MPAPSSPPIGVVQERPQEEELNIDYEGLQRSLGLARPVDDFGFIEQGFATCEAGHGYSATRNCRRDRFVLIHFQLLCRDSVGTVSTALGESDLRPLAGRDLEWSLSKKRGTLRLDGSGRGQIRTTASESQKGRRLKLAVDNDFLYIQAGDAKRLVTPSTWCD